MSDSNYGRETLTWEARENGALLRTQAKLELLIMPTFKSGASDTANKGKRKLNASQVS